MSKKIRIFDHFQGGISVSRKEGAPGSFQNSRSIDIDSEPTSFKILPKTAKISSTTVTDLIKWFATAKDGNIYAIDAGNDIYKDASGTVTKVVNNSTGAGQGLAYRDDDDYLYYSLTTTIGRFGPITNSPSNSTTFFEDDVYNLDQSLDTSGNTYTLTTGVNEGATHRQTFTPTRDPIKSIQVNLGTRGTGNWTLTLHDSLNVSIGTVTIANASLAASGDQKFTFSTPLRVFRNNDYHFHLTSTVADGTVVTTTASDLETADFHEYFGILISNTDYQPMIDFKRFLVFGNSDYVGSWNGYDYPINSNAIEIPLGYKVRCLAKLGDYVVAGCWKGASSSQSINDTDKGLLVFWDGEGPAYTYAVEIPEGAVNSVFTDQNRLFFVAGNQGKLYVYTDGVQAVDQLPRMTKQTYVEVAPGAMGMWQGNLLIGAPVNTDADDIFETSVYTYGQPTKDYSESLTQDYPISTGTLTSGSNNLKIGAVLGQGQTLHIGWRDDTVYGWDTVGPSSQPFTSASWESLMIDDGKPYHQKVADVIRVDHSTLISNQEVYIDYKIDRATNWTAAASNSTAGTTDTRFNLNKRFKELEVRVRLVTSSTNDLEVYAVTISYEDRSDEEVV
jgi:hypothetical protein